MENDIQRKRFSSLVYISLVLSAIISGVTGGLTIPQTLARICFGMVLGTVFIVLLHNWEDKLWNQIPSKTIYSICFVISVCLIGVSAGYSVGVYWMVLLVYVACQCKLETMFLSYGMLLAVYLTQALTVDQDIPRMEYYLVVGVVLILLFNMMKQKQELPYAGVILLALAVAMMILLEGFQVSGLWAKRYEMVMELSSLLFLILFGALFKMCPSLWIGKQMGREDILLAYLQDQYPMMVQMKQQEEIYNHCYEISRVSTLAAKAIGADSLLAGVAGMYHEMGRLRSQDNYVEENKIMAEKLGFSQELQAVIRQHNTGSELPQSPEAAIVMLSDCIVSTRDYLVKSGKRNAITDEKLVSGIFANRQAKGSLEASGLQEEELNKLQRFFVAQMAATK